MVQVNDFLHLRDAAQESDALLRKAAQAIESLAGGLADDVCVLVVGSYGRKEARAGVSDLEWLLLFDDERVASEEAALFQAKVTGKLAEIVGRKRLSIGKTFGTLCPLSALRSNIGGIADTNRMLTYRVLTLTEGYPLISNDAYNLTLETLAKAYGASHTAGHRLLSLATEISRYWRTLRIDYKHKVDEEGKPWAVRSFKLRAARRFAYLSSAMHFVAFGPRIQSGGTEQFALQDIIAFMRSMSISPLERMIRAWIKMGGAENTLIGTLVLYDEICGHLADPSVRQALDHLQIEGRRNNFLYVELRRKAQNLHSSMAALALQMPDPHRTQLLEMFLL